VTPDFDDLIGSEGSPEELAELRRMHELLLSADPPPDLAPPLRAPAPAPEPERRRRRPRLRWQPVRRYPVLASGVAASFCAALGVAVALLASHGGSGFAERFARPMHGVGATAAAQAVIQVGKADGSGNRPLEFTVRSLPVPPPDSQYQLFLTEHGKPVVLCGIFRTGPTGTARVRMNAPADLEEYDGWIVRTSGSHRVVLAT